MGLQSRLPYVYADTQLVNRIPDIPYGMGRLLDISPNGWRLINVYSDDVCATRLEFDELAIPRIHRREGRLLNVDARRIEYRTAHKCYGYVNDGVTNVIGV